MDFLPNFLRRAFGHADVSTSEQQEAAEELLDGEPRVSFDSLTFSDGTRIELGPTDIICLVGPNNAGKSRALRDLKDLLAGDKSRGVISEASIRKQGTLRELRHYLDEHAYRFKSGSVTKYSGEGFSVNEFELSDRWSGKLQDLSRFFLELIETGTRLSGSNAPESIDAFSSIPKHPVHRLFLDDSLEALINNHFRAAFKQNLIVHRAGGRTLPLLVGTPAGPLAGEDRISISYLERLKRETSLLQEQGDGMRSFATVILHLLVSRAQTIFLLDEPEAFLHPPQARLLGEAMARERLRPSQLFISTHSPDILSGLLSATPDRLRIVRLQRSSALENKAKELSPAVIEEIATDPVMKFTSVLSGLFHKRVIICESDSDCLFYSSILDSPDVNQGVPLDVLFLQVAGKHRMSVLADLLRQLDVTVDVIADIDLLSETKAMSDLVLALGEKPKDFERDLKVVQKAVEDSRSWLDAPLVAEQLHRIFGRIPLEGAFPKDLKAEVTSLMRRTSPWSSLKHAGFVALPKGDATLAFQNLCLECSRLGLWIVPVGELEGFCRAQGGHGPTWVQEVLKQYDLRTSSELSEARDFVSKIWQRI